MKTECQSCGGNAHVDEDEATCRGCGLVVCDFCVHMFNHFGEQEHGSGNPEEELEKLRRKASRFDLFRRLIAALATDSEKGE